MRTLGKVVIWVVIITVAHFTGALTAVTENFRQHAGLTNTEQVPLTYPTPQAAAPVATDNPAAYKFLRVNSDGSPVTWNTCKPIEFVINPAGASPGAVEEMKTAIDMVAKASGFNLKYREVTKPSPEKDWFRTAPQKPGSAVEIHWTPVLMSPGVAGESLVRAMPNSQGNLTNVSAQIRINKPLDAGREPGFGVNGRANTYLHELSHLLGLDHVAHPLQVMSIKDRVAQGLGAGDLEGLRILGSQPCQ